VRHHTHGQAYCWLKYSDAYEYENVADWPTDPFLYDFENHLSFKMPDSRRYEHFYNDPDCNQIFHMGRGKVQPDAITFEDVGPHDYNTLLMTNRFSITPWKTHDQMVIQMFGITEQCVAVRPDDTDRGRGLTNGTFRIEYRNQTGLQKIESEDFCQTTEISKCVYSSNGGDRGGLLEDRVCIHRTPHYLAICTDNSEEN
jgi:hypothetical protein